MEINEKKLQTLIGFEPHPAQQEILNCQGREIIVCAGRRFGKSLLASYIGLKELLEKKKRIWIVAPCVDEKTEILTKRGWLLYKNLKIGDEVLTLNKDGKAEWQKCLKVNVFDYDGELISIELKTHSSLTTLWHRWLVGYITSNPKKRILGYRFTTTEKMTKPNEFVLGGAEVTNLPKEKKYKDSFVELVGWYWTEGGYNGSGIMITQNKGKKADRIRKCLLDLFGKPSKKRNYTPTIRKIWKDWKPRTKKENEKQGDFYLNKNIAKLLEKVAPDKVIKPEFITSLTKDQLELLINISVLADGYKRKYEKLIVQKRKDRLEMLQMAGQLAGYQTTLHYNQGKYILRFLKRNKVWLGQKPQLKKRKRVKYKGIVWCPTTSNGTWLARRNGTVYFTGNSYDISQIVFDTILKWLLKIATSGRTVDVKKRPFPQITTAAGSILECKSTENPIGLLGRATDLIIVDEAARISEAIWNEYLFPTTHDRAGRTIFISTPCGQNWFYKKFLQLKEEKAAFQYPSNANPHFSEEEWERAKRLLPERVFLQEYLATFLPEAASLFRGVDEIIHQDALENPQPGHYYIIGVDLAKYQDFTVFIVLDRTTHKVVAYDRFQEINYPLQKMRLIALAKKYNNAKVIIDSTGLGDPIADDLRHEGLLVEDFKFTGKSKMQLIDKLSIFIEQKGIIIPPIPELIDELKIFSYEISDAGNIRYTAPRGFRDDAVIALSLAVWGLTSPTPQTQIQRSIPTYHRKFDYD